MFIPLEPPPRIISISEGKSTSHALIANVAEIIEAGARLAVDESGFVRPLRTVEFEGVQLAERAPTLGIALDEVASEGLLWVLVNPH